MLTFSTLKDFFTPSEVLETEIDRLDNAYYNNDRKLIKEIIEATLSKLEATNTQFENIISKFGFAELEEMLEDSHNAFFASMIANPNVSLGLIEKLGDYLQQRIESEKAPDYYNTLLDDITIVMLTRKQIQNWKPGKDKDGKSKDFYSLAGLDRNDFSSLQRYRIKQGLRITRGLGKQVFDQSLADKKLVKQIAKYAKASPETLKEYRELTVGYIINSKANIKPEEILRIANERVAIFTEVNTSGEHVKLNLRAFNLKYSIDLENGENSKNKLLTLADKFVLARKKSNRGTVPQELHGYLYDTQQMISRAFQISPEKALVIAKERIAIMTTAGLTMPQIRNKVRAIQESHGLDTDIIKDSLDERQETMVRQWLPFLVGAKNIGDIGAGDLGNSNKIANHPKLPMVQEIVATDFVEYEGQQQISDKIRFIQVNSLELPYGIGDESLDAICIGNVTHHHPFPEQIPAFLEAVMRKLKPNGKLIITDTTSSKDDREIFNGEYPVILSNDWDYNHLINKTDGKVPVPGGFLTTTEMVNILKKMGYYVTNTMQYGQDMKIIADYHNGIVAQKIPTSKDKLANNISRFNRAKAQRNNDQEIENKNSDRKSGLAALGLAMVLASSGIKMQSIGSELPALGAFDNQPTPISRNVV